MQWRYLSTLQDRPISLPVEECSCLSPSRLCSCDYHSCELCLLGCYQSSVPTHFAKFRDNLFFPAWLLAVGRSERKSSETNTLKKMGGRERGREGNGVSATLHPPSLTPLLFTKGYCFPLLCLYDPPAFLASWSSTEIFLNRSMWFSISLSLFSTICCFFSLQQPHYPAHPTSLFWSDILPAASLFQPAAALGPAGFCLLLDSVGYRS